MDTSISFCDFITEAVLTLDYTGLKEKGGTVMGLFNFLHNPDINQGLKEYHETPSAVLLDVRTPPEYREGHIPGSKNIPLQKISGISGADIGKERPLFVYCHSGARSRQAVSTLQRMGYLNVKNIGGISAYTGKVESI